MKWNQETIKSKVRKFLAERNFESEDTKHKEEVLAFLPTAKSFYNAVKLCVESNYCSAELLQRYFGISTEQVMNFIYAMEALEFITETDANDAKWNVLPESNDFLHFMDNITYRENSELMGHRYFKTRKEYDKYIKDISKDISCLDSTPCDIEEEALKEILYKNGAYYLNGYNNLTWCEVSSNDDVCLTQIFYRNIPADCRKVNAEEYSFSVKCRDNSEARYCAKMLADLIFAGYKLRCNWFLPMDISDLETIFSKESRFIHFGCQPIADVASIILETKKDHEVFVYIRVNTQFTERGFEPSVSSIEESFSAFLNRLNINRAQISLDDDTAGAPFEVVMWYI